MIYVKSNMNVRFVIQFILLFEAFCGKKIYKVTKC